MNASGATLLHAFILAQLAFFNGLPNARDGDFSPKRGCKKTGKIG